MPLRVRIELIDNEDALVKELSKFYIWRKEEIGSNRYSVYRVRRDLNWYGDGNCEEFVHQYDNGPDACVANALDALIGADRQTPPERRFNG